MSSAKDRLRETRAEARPSAQSTGAGRTTARVREWARDRSLGIFFVSVFLVTWIAQLFFEWQVYAQEQRDHGATAHFWSGGFWNGFWQSTLENWQSEFLQLAAFTIAAAYFVFKGSSESPDSSERLELKLDTLLQLQGVDPKEVEGLLPLKHRKTR
jgi:hypothetical protein